MAVVSGGTTLIDNGALDAAVPSGSLILLSTQTASASATISFTSGIDSTYDSYVFKFYNIHPSTNSYTQFQCTTDGTNYNTTITSTIFSGYHDEADSFAILQYFTTGDQAQGTSFQILNETDNVGTDNDMSMSGSLTLYNPSSTTFVKHFLANTNSVGVQPLSANVYTAGYFNTTNSITGIKFQQSSGNIDDGIIKMYGVS
jgi:hypothetical protein